MKTSHLFRGVFLSLLSFAVGHGAFAATFDSGSNIMKISGIEQAKLGYAVAVNGDVNGDGYADVLVNYYNDATTTDSALLYYGSADGFAATLSTEDSDATFNGVLGDGYGYGATVSYAGDVNGDGYDDILIGDSFANSVAGEIFLVYGSDTRFSGSVDLTGLSDSEVDVFVGEAAINYAGVAVSSAGDVNGDSYDDFLIGAHWADSKAGAAYLLYGTPAKHTGTTNLASADAKFSGEAAENLAGDHLASGDVNGDGYSDLVISASKYSSYTGRVYVVYGGEAALIDQNLSAADAFFTGTEEYDGFGGGQTDTADINGDGYDDLLFGMTEAGTGADTIPGGLYIEYGQASALTSKVVTTADTKITVSGSDGSYVFDVANNGDLDGDGYEDLVFTSGTNSTADYSVYVFNGSASPFPSSLEATTDADTSITGDVVNEGLGTSLSMADATNDGLPELFFGAPVDSSAAANAGSIYAMSLYVDSDRDGVVGPNGLILGADCDDEDGDISTEQTYYADADEDGEGDDGAQAVVCQLAPPDGYVANNDDENDNDFDNDGTETEDDCDDADSTVVDLITYYADTDADTFGDPDSGAEFCALTAPVGYVSNANDTDDTSLGSIAELTVADGVVTVAYESGFRQEVMPFTAGANVKTVMASDGLRWVAANGKSVRVFFEGSELDRQKLFKKKSNGKSKLKIVSFYSGYETVIYVSERNKTGRIAAMRLTEANTFTKLDKETVQLQKKNLKVRVKVKLAKHRFHVRFGKNENLSHTLWKVTKKGKLKSIAL